MRHVRFTRRAFEQWFPTLSRYVGLLLMVYAGLIDRGKNPALIPAATGLVFLKSVIGSE